MAFEFIQFNHLIYSYLTNICCSLVFPTVPWCSYCSGEHFWWVICSTKSALLFPKQTAQNHT